MSLDLWLVCPICKEHSDEFGFNYTYNVSSMWYEIYPEATGMVDIDGMTGKEAKTKLHFAYMCLIKFPEKYKAMEPANKWGSYGGFVSFIEQLMKACEEYPDRVWESWR